MTLSKQDTCIKSRTTARVLDQARLSLRPRVLQNGSEGRASETEMWRYQTVPNTELSQREMEFKIT